MNWKHISLRLAPLAALVLLAGGAFVASPYRTDELAPARQWFRPSYEHPFGCGELGVDLLALTSNAVLRVVALSVSVALLSCAIGAPVGAIAAFARGRTERGVARACDLVQAFPSFLLAMVVLSAVRSPSRMHLALVLLLASWAPFARLALSQAQVVRESLYVSAAMALGSSRSRMVFRHILPNVLPVALVQLGSTAASLVVSEASLSFVGLGPRDGISLGQLIDQGTLTMFRTPHVLVVGTLSLFLTSGALLVSLRPGPAGDTPQR